MDISQLTTIAEQIGTLGLGIGLILQLGKKLDDINIELHTLTTELKTLLDQNKEKPL